MASITLVVGVLPVIEWHHLVQEKPTLLPSFNYCVQVLVKSRLLD